MDKYIGRQPIFNREKDIIAYELLYRDSDSTYANIQNPDYATSSVLHIGSMVATFGSLSNNKPVFVNFTKNLITDDTALLYRNNMLIIELLEDIVPDDDFFKKLDELKEKNYTLAIDDYTSAYKYPEIINYVDIVKVDFMQTTELEQKQIIEKLSRKGLQFLAEKIETIEEFDRALSYGYELFQGYYLAKPSILNYKDISSLGSTHFNVIRALEDPSATYEKIEKLVQSDVSLAYKLIKYSNSVRYGSSEKIHNIKDALVRLGLVNIKNLMYLIFLRVFSKGQNSEFVRLSLFRAKMMETLAYSALQKQNYSDFFLSGLFSMLDVLLQSSFDEVFKELPLSQDIKSAITEKTDNMGSMLLLVESYEKGNWDLVEEKSKEFNFSSELLAKTYLDAMDWSENILSL